MKFHFSRRKKIKKNTKIKKIKKIKKNLLTTFITGISDLK